MAESTTVPGDQPGDITSMFVDNARSKLTVKIAGLSRPCDARQVSAAASWRGDPGEYRAQGACVAGTTWAKELLYFPVGGGEDAVGQVVTDEAVHAEDQYFFHYYSAPRVYLVQ